jgi:hypothetical protein
MEGGLQRDSYLAGEDNNFADRPSNLVLQELADEETTKVAGPDDSETFVPGHACRDRCYCSA